MCGGVGGVQFLVGKGCSSCGAEGAEVLAQLSYDLPATYKFHRHGHDRTLSLGQGGLWLVVAGAGGDGHEVCLDGA